MTEATYAFLANESPFTTMTHCVTLRLTLRTCRTAGFYIRMYSPVGGMDLKKEGTSMAGWEQELAGLLRELGVTQEEPRTHPPFSHKLMHSDIKRRVFDTDAFFLSDTKEIEAEDEEVWMSDLATMHREIDSIVRQVIHLMQSGDLDLSLK